MGDTCPDGHDPAPPKGTARMIQRSGLSGYEPEAMAVHLSPGCESESRLCGFLRELALYLAVFFGEIASTDLILRAFGTFG